MAFFEEIRKSTTGALDRAKLVLSSQPSEDVEEQKQPDRLEELSEYCPKLSFQERLIGFAVCFSLGYLIAFFSFRFFVRLVEGHPLPFVLNYTFGHILQLLSSTFLCGPKRQFKNMFDEKRRMTSIVYLSCLGGTLVFIFIPFPGVLKLIILLLLTMAQFAASLWYTLSYIPYGRRTFSRMVKRALGIEESGSNYAGVVGDIGMT